MAETTSRKKEHISICVKNNVQARSIQTGFNDVLLIHKAMPEASLKEVDTSINFFKHKLNSPLVIEAMTGGTDKASKINGTLAEAAERFKIAMGVGSQRVALENASLVYSFKIAREKAPKTFLIGNLGAPQIVGESGLENVQNAIQMIDADAFAIHMNSLQEAIQSEGNTNLNNLAEKIKIIVSKVDLPIIAKETGSGFAAEEVCSLKELGVKGIDAGGAGGTSWAAVESYRAKMKKDKLGERLGYLFWDWGIPTVVSIVEASQTTNLTIIASGGIRNGIEVVKAIALGADAAGVALPLLKPAIEGTVNDYLKSLVDEIKITMFLVGAKSVEELKQIPLVIIGRTAEWLRSRGFKPEKYARRRNS